MQTLVFNSTEKTVEIFPDMALKNPYLKYDNVPTVRPKDGYYEVIRKDNLDDAVAYPVARFPISGTNMIIEKN
jgi:hypothetical protein